MFHLKTNESLMQEKRNKFLRKERKHFKVKVRSPTLDEQAISFVCLRSVCKGFLNNYVAVVPTLFFTYT